MGNAIANLWLGESPTRSEGCRRSEDGVRIQDAQEQRPEYWQWEFSTRKRGTRQER